MDRGSVVRLLVDAGADPNIRDANGNIPLTAISMKAPRARLIDAVGDVNAPNNSGLDVPVTRCQHYYRMDDIA